MTQKTLDVSELKTLIEAILHAASCDFYLAEFRVHCTDVAEVLCDGLVDAVTSAEAQAAVDCWLDALHAECARIDHLILAEIAALPHTGAVLH
jgi:hypothetical protein